MVSPPRLSWLLPRGAATLLALAASVSSASTQGIILFEDLWPKTGDLDFNDQAVAYNFTVTTDSIGIKVTGVKATFNVLAVGSTIHNGLYLHLPVAATAVSGATVDFGQGPVTIDPVNGEAQAVIPVVADTRSLFGGATGMINTDPGLPHITSPTVQLNIQFATAVDLTDLAPFDLFLARTGDNGHQIHVPQYSGTNLVDQSLFNTFDDNSSAATGRYYVNTQGVPFALSVPQVIQWPVEHTPIDLAYPDIVGYFASGGTQNTDWYLTNVNQQYLYSSVPEPGSLLVLAMGSIALTARRRAR